MVLIFQALKTAGRMLEYGDYGREVDTYVCVPVNADKINQLMNKVKEAAKAIGANLLCGGTIERHDDPNDKWRTKPVPRDTCYVYFYGPAYHYT